MRNYLDGIDNKNYFLHFQLKNYDIKPVNCNKYHTIHQIITKDLDIPKDINYEIKTHAGKILDKNTPLLWLGIRKESFLILSPKPNLIQGDAYFNCSMCVKSTPINRKIILCDIYKQVNLDNPEKLCLEGFEPHIKRLELINVGSQKVVRLWTKFLKDHKKLIK